MKSRSSFLSMKMRERRAEPVLPIWEYAPVIPSCIFQFWKLCTAVSVFSVGITVPNRLSIFHWKTPMGSGFCFPRVVSRPHEVEFLSLSCSLYSLWMSSSK